MTAPVSGSRPKVVIIGSSFAARRLINADVDLTLAGDIGRRNHSMRKRGVAVVVGVRRRQIPGEPGHLGGQFHRCVAGATTRNVDAARRAPGSVRSWAVSNRSSS